MSTNCESLDALQLLAAVNYYDERPDDHPFPNTGLIDGTDSNQAKDVKVTLHALIESTKEVGFSLEKQAQLRYIVTTHKKMV